MAAGDFRPWGDVPFPNQRWVPPQQQIPGFPPIPPFWFAQNAEDDAKAGWHGVQQGSIPADSGVDTNSLLDLLRGLNPPFQAQPTQPGVSLQDLAALQQIVRQARQDEPMTQVAQVQPAPMAQQPPPQPQPQAPVATVQQQTSDPAQQAALLAALHEAVARNDNPALMQLAQLANDVDQPRRRRGALEEMMAYQDPAAQYRQQYHDPRFSYVR